MRPMADEPSTQRSRLGWWLLAGPVAGAAAGGIVGIVVLLAGALRAGELGDLSLSPVAVVLGGMVGATGGLATALIGGWSLALADQVWGKTTSASRDVKVAAVIAGALTALPVVAGLFYPDSRGPETILWSGPVLFIAWTAGTVASRIWNRMSSVAAKTPSDE